MRILHVSTRLILGGSQENTVLSCEEQARRGHEVHLAFGPIYGPEGSMLARVEAFNARCASGKERAKPIGLHLIRNMVRQIAPLKDWLCYHELRSTVRELAPDVVHTHSSKAGILGRLAAWSIAEERARKHSAGAVSGPPGPPRVVHTIHGPPWQAGESAWREWVYVRSERLAAKKCHAIVSVADAMTSQFLERGIGTPDLYTTVRSGMEVEPFLRAHETRDTERRGMGFGPADVVIGTVARLAELKGHDDVLDAMAGEIVARRDSASRIKLLWVGDGWKREDLVARARGLGLRVREFDRGAAGSAGVGADEDSDIVLSGLVPSERIPALMGAMDILAHPSRREGLPRTVPQALLAGVCPVATDADGTREVCVEMETGRLVAVGDIGALRSALLWCVDHPRERAALAAHGRARCERAFTVAAMADGLERVYATRSDA